MQKIDFSYLVIASLLTAGLGTFFAPQASNSEVPPYPEQPDPNTPIRPEFENPGSNQSPSACGSETVTRPSNRNDSYDRSPYKVWIDFSHGQETIYPSACARQYWIKEDKSHPKYGIRFVYLLDGQGKCVAPFLYKEAEDGKLSVVRDAPECSPDSGIAGAW